MPGDLGILCASVNVLQWLELPSNDEPSLYEWVTISSAEELRYKHALRNLDGDSVYIFGGSDGKWHYLDRSQSPPMFVDQPARVMERARSGMAVVKVSSYFFPQCLKQLLLW